MSEDITQDAGVPEDPSRNLQAGGEFAQYEVVKKLGEGGFGAVFLVKNSLGHLTALKILHADKALDGSVRQRFLNEMSVTLELLHENAVPVRDANQWQGCLYYTMDYVEGETVHDILQRDGAVEPARAVDWVRQTLGFVGFLHNKGFVHRDLKPENLMVQVQPDGTERIRVLDLGIAKSLLVDESAPMLTGGEQRIGTPDYMAPEYLLTDDWDHRIDLWAMGIILYECLTKSRPYSGPDSQSVVDAIAFREPKPILEVDGNIPPALSKVVHKALQKVPDQRYGSAREFDEDLRSVQRGVDPGARTVTDVRPSKSASGKQEKKSSMAGLVVVALVLVLGGAAFFFRDAIFGGDEPDRGSGSQAALSQGGSSSDGPRNGSPSSSTPKLAPPPELRIPDQPRDGSRVRGNPFELRVRTEAGEGKLRYELNDMPATVVTSGGVQTIRQPLPEDVEEIKLRVIDEADRSDEVVMKLRVDNTPPTVLGQITPARVIGEKDAELRIPFSEAIDFGDLQILGADKPRPETSEGTALLASIPFPGYGTHDLSLKFRDLAGNEGTTLRHTIRFEARPETFLTVLSPAANARTVKGRQIPVTVEAEGQPPLAVRFGEDGDFVEVGADGRASQTLSLDVLDGENTLKLTVRSGTGADAVEDDETLVIVADNTPPAAPRFDPPDGSWLLPNGEVTVTAAEPLGAARVGGMAATLSEDGTSFRFKVRQNDSPLQITLRDRLGNEQAFEFGYRAPLLREGFSLAEETKVTLHEGRGLFDLIVHDATGMRFRLITPPPGSLFEVGAPPNAKLTDDDSDFERPRHPEGLTSFYLGESEVSWSELQVAKDSHAKNGGVFTDSVYLALPDSGTVYASRAMPAGVKVDRLPVEWITYLGALEYCRWMGGDLPTEVQWEWAARGSPSPVDWEKYLDQVYPWGNVFDAAAGAGKFHANCATPADWGRVADQDDQTSPTDDGVKYAAEPGGKFLPNRFGLYHMVGNVMEWCRDEVRKNYKDRRDMVPAPVDYCSIQPVDAGSLDTETYFALRGGGYRDRARKCRPTFRQSYPSVRSKFEFGFRVMLPIGDE